MKIYPHCTKAFYGRVFAVDVIICFIVSGVVIRTDPNRPETGTITQCLGNALYLSMAWGFFVFVCGLFQVFLLWRNRDGYFMKREFRIYIICAILFCAGYVTTYFYPQYDEVYILIACFIGTAATNISIYFPIYLSYKPQWSGVASKEGSINTESTKLNSKELLRYVLDTPALLESFKEFSVELWCAENIQFYLEVQRFRKSIEEGNSGDVVNDIFETFFLPGAVSLINIDEVVHERCIRAFKEGQVTASLFDEAEGAVILQMRQDTFSKFKLSGRLEQAWRKAGLGELNEAVRDDIEPKISPTRIELMRTSASDAPASNEEKEKD